MAFLCACAPFKVSDVRIGDTPARRIAKDTAIAGKGVDGQCLPFARALNAKFKSAGIASKIVSFCYETLPTPTAILGNPSVFPSISERGGLSGEHAVVVYEDQGRAYVMDNQSWQPKWIHGSTPLQISQEFSGMDVAISAARIVDAPVCGKSRLLAACDAYDARP